MNEAWKLHSDLSCQGFRQIVAKDDRVVAFVPVTEDANLIASTQILKGQIKLLREALSELRNLLLEALPFIEDMAEMPNPYKPGVPQNLATRIKALLEKT